MSEMVNPAKLRAKADRLVIDFRELVPKKSKVRFNAHPEDNPDDDGEPRPPVVQALYLERAGWDELGQPAQVRITITRLP